MRPYEVMVIFEPALEESAVQAVINRSTEILEKREGSVGSVDKWGKRRLAYEIDHRTEGFYVLMAAQATSEGVDELDRSLRLADEVLRHKIVRIPDAVAGRQAETVAVEAGPES